MLRSRFAEPIDATPVSTFSYCKKVFDTEQSMAQLTRDVTDLPIMICGNIYDRTRTEGALKHADIVQNAKSILLNRNWVENNIAGKELPLHE